MADPDFSGDIYALLWPGVEYDPKAAYKLIKTEIIEEIWIMGYSNLIVDLKEIIISIIKS